MTLLHDLELKELTKGVIVPEGGVKENNIHKVMQKFNPTKLLTFALKKCLMAIAVGTAPKTCAAVVAWGTTIATMTI